MKTIWEEIKIKDFPKLTKDIKTNVLIIGGGIVGILLAHELKQRNIDYILVEKDKIASGTTKDTTAFVTIQHETLYQDLINKHGIKAANEYLDLNLKGLNYYKDLSKTYDFDFTECSSTLYSKNSEELILKEKEALDRLGLNSIIEDEIPLERNIKKAITIEKQAIINPLKLIKALSEDLNIYEHTLIKHLKNHYAYTDDGVIINFNNVVIATNYPFKNVSGLYFLKLIQRRSSVCVVDNIKIDGTYCNIDEGGMYFRSYNDKLIIGGNDRDTKEVCKGDFLNKVKYLVGEKDIEYIWSGQDCITLDGVPYIGKYSIFKPYYYVVSGFALWGFTWAAASSCMISDMIEGKKEYELTLCTRNIFTKQLLKNTLTSVKNLVTFKKPRCTHLGCKLNFNKEEHTWECPCHGSRFDSSGKVLKGPALKDLNELKTNDL